MLQSLVPSGPSPKMFFHISLLAALKCEGGKCRKQRPKNFHEKPGEHPLTKGWNRLIFPISYSNYNSLSHCHPQSSLQLEDCSAEARPSSSLLKSFVMEMSFGIWKNPHFCKYCLLGDNPFLAAIRNSDHRHIKGSPPHPKDPWPEGILRAYYNPFLFLKSFCKYSK